MTLQALPLNQILTFSRDSGATRVNAAGLIVGVDFSSTSNTIGTGSRTFTLTADDSPLLEHEKFHVRQWWAWVVVFAALACFVPVDADLGYTLPVAVALMGTCFHAILYEGLRTYREWSEVQAYKIQIAMGGITLDRAAEVLSKYYRLGISVNEARELLK